jgi:hypothetical protein
MTRQKSFKRLVRTRMEKTGESYTAARAALLGPGTTVLATSDATILERTGRGWEEWFDLLDEWGAADKSHREIARDLAARVGLDPLAWNVQAVVGSYEKARRGREVGQMEDGFRCTASRTVAAPIEEVYAAFLAEPGLTYRSGTAPRTAHFDTLDGRSRVHVGLAADGDRTKISVEQARLPDAPAADKAKAHWRDRLNALKATMEGQH